jgi:hypothetical protein
MVCPFVVLRRLLSWKAYHTVWARAVLRPDTPGGLA